MEQPGGLMDKELGQRKQKGEAANEKERERLWRSTCTYLGRDLGSYQSFQSRNSTTRMLKSTKSFGSNISSTKITNY